MRQVFPFGRGDRGSRQRLVLEFSKWGGGGLVQHEVRVKVLRTHELDLTVLLLGTSVLRGKRSLVFDSAFRRGFKALVQAVKDFPASRRNNKLWQEKRRLYGGTGKFH